ncbi:M23 family metallopeptidase [Novosphingobium sp. ZN18A2]|uniref:M23 family metallopeptidase n=1 Tax=Novosphingobium sp. ZN18A2 TaxID=3079861 RepID=UPI0030D2A5AB
MTNILSLKSALGTVAAIASTFGAAPAFANSASSADITTPIRAAEASRSSSGTGAPDAEFSRLFSSWQKLDGEQSTVTPLHSATQVSIPSMAPLDAIRMTSGFGMRHHPILGGRRKHDGVDLASPVGTPVHATADGVVEKASWFGGYGLFVELEHGANMETRYGHMSKIAVAEGQRVHKGDVIGYVGSTGRSTGPHLHYEVRVNGVPVNPLVYMQDDSTQLLASAN